MNNPLVLVTGATGYVGGKLIEALTTQKVRIRALARDPRKVDDFIQMNAEVVQGDLLDPVSLTGALAGVHTAYYLVHSMGSGDAYARMDREAATIFREVARGAGVQRIVYLGGLGDSSTDLSPHLFSRQEVGRILKEGGVQVIELRASIVLGVGSTSFEMIRALCERLPMMVTPRWVASRAQPIAIQDLLEYLLLSGVQDFQGHQVFEIGGPDQVGYNDIMKEYCQQRKLRRVMIPIPVLTPRLSSLWLQFVTPLYATVGRALIDSIRNPTVVTDDSALAAFPVKPMGIRQAIRMALKKEDDEVMDMHWAQWSGSRQFRNYLIDSRTIMVNKPVEQAFTAIERIGGKNGWYFADWLWTLRGWLDRLVGGVGMRRARTHDTTLREGDFLDFWRIEKVKKNEALVLRAEMKVPGRAWLKWEFDPQPNGMTRICQTAIFDPLGMPGLGYWFLVTPLHDYVFAGLLNRIARFKISSPSV